MHTSILPFAQSEIKTLVEISRETFIQSHGHSANPEAISTYVDAQFTTKILSEAIQDSCIFYSKILVNNALAGYSKLIVNTPHPNTTLFPVAKFERMYLLKDYYGLGLGKELLVYNLNLAKTHEQKALWLNVWSQNKKGLKFYQKHNFEKIGTHDFKLSASHSNLDYVMLKVI